MRLRGTVYPETFSDFRRGGTLGRPRFPAFTHVLASPQGRPLWSPLHGQDGASGRPRPTEVSRIFQVWGRGTPWAARRGVCIPRTPPHPPQCAHWGTFPLGGGRLGGRTLCAPAVEDRLVSLARQSQAQSLNRTSPNFYKPRARWPGGNLDQSLRFCALETLLNFSGGALVNGVRRKANRSAVPALRLSRPRWRFAFFFAMEKEGRRPHCARRRVSERNRPKGGS